MLCFSVFVNAETTTVSLDRYNFSCYDMEDGLPQNSISDIAISHDGQLIITTFAGVTVFDGKKFTTLIPGTDKSFPKIEPYTLDVDNQGAIWVGTTTDGIYRFYNGTEQHWHKGNGLKSNFIYKLETGNGNAYVINDDEILVVNPDEFPNVQTLDSSLFRMQVYSMFKDNNENLLMATNKGVWKNNSGQWQSSLIKENGLVIDNFNSGVTLNDDTMFLAQNRRVLKVTNGKAEVYIPELGKDEDVIVTKMLLDHDEHLWMNTEGHGLLRYSALGLEVLNYFPNTRVFSIVEDNQGVIWIGTSGGLCSLKYGAITSIAKEQGLKDEYIHFLAKDNQDKVYLVPYSPTTELNYIIDNQVHLQDIIISNDPKAEGNEINVISFDDDGNMWLALNNIIGKIVEDKFMPIVALENPVYTFLLDQNKYIWFEDNNKLVRYTLENSISEEISLNGDNKIRIMMLNKTVNGDIILAERSNAYRIVDLQASKIDVPINISSCAHEFVEDETWICGEGLWLLKDGESYYFDDDKGLTNGHTHDVISDNSGNIWVTSNSGLFRLLRADIDNIADIKDGQKIFRQFTEIDGMKSSEFNGGQKSAVKTSDGFLWFAGQGGVTVVDPELEKFKSNKKFTPYIEHMYIGEDLMKPLKQMIIDPNPSSVHYHFNAIYLSDGDNLVFRHRLLPLEQEWQTRDVADYPSLEAGNYQLEYQVKYFENDWSEVVINEFTVLQIWYETIWFRILLALSLLLIVIGIPLWRIKWLKQYQKQLELLVEDKTDSLRKANKRLEKISRSDELTAIANRREFIERMSLLCKKPNHQICLALIDVDDFKAYNDYYGHIAGDDCLVQVAVILDAFSSEKCLVARFGGEEFVILFDDYTLSGAKGVSHQIYTSLEDNNIAHEKSSVKSILSISTGLIIRKQNESVESCIDRADMLMYQAKAEGKDRLITEDEVVN